MAFTQSFTSARSTPPDPGSLQAQARALDATAVVYNRLGTQDYVVEKATAWTGGQIAQAQNVIDTAPEATLQLAAQSAIDALPLIEKAILLTLLDEINRLRTQPTTTFATISTATAIAAVRAKAGTL